MRDRNVHLALLCIAPSVALVAAAPERWMVGLFVMFVAVAAVTARLRNSERVLLFVVLSIAAIMVFVGRQALPLALGMEEVLLFGGCAGFFVDWVHAPRSGSLVRANRMRMSIQLTAFWTALVAISTADTAFDGLLVRALTAATLFACLAAWPFSLDAWRRLRALSPARVKDGSLVSKRDRYVDYGVGEREESFELAAPAGFRENARPATLTLKGDHKVAVKGLRIELAVASVLLLLVLAMTRSVFAKTFGSEPSPSLLQDDSQLSP